MKLDGKKGWKNDKKRMDENLLIHLELTTSFHSKFKLVSLTFNFNSISLLVFLRPYISTYDTSHKLNAAATFR